MNKKISDTEFRESIDRRLSILQPDPWMAKRIIASGKGEIKVKKKLSGVTIVIAVILVLTMATAIAAKLAGWSGNLEVFLHVTDETRERHQNTGLFDEPGLSVTENEVTITLDKCVTVANTSYMAFRVQGFPLAPGQYPEMADISCEVDQTRGTLGWDARFENGLIEGPDGEYVYPDGSMPDPDSTVSYADENGDLLLVISVNMPGSDVNLVGRSMKVVLDKLEVHGGQAGDPIHNTDGPWEFNWTMKGTDIHEDITGLSLPIGEEGCMLTEAHIWPIYIDLRMVVPRELNEHSVMEDAVPFFTGVKYTDGTVLTGIGNGGSEGYESMDSSMYREAWAMDHVIDPEKVESLLFYWTADWGNDGLPGWDEEEHEPVLYEIKIR